MKAKKTDRIERQGVGHAMTAFEKIDFAFREQHESDYGVDAHIELIEDERPTGQLLGVQLKTGESYLSERVQNGFVFRTDGKHIEYWLNHSLPIIITLCDLENSKLYWQHISRDNALQTGKGYNIIIPFEQRVDADSVDLLKSLVTIVVSPSLYTVFKTEDVSHGLAKRYSIDIVLNGLKTKSEITAAIRQATSETVKRRHYRNHIVEGRWGDADADVVWIFAYLTPNDRSLSNWICRSIWIREDLPENSRPMSFEGENIGGLITVDWTSHYKEFAEIASNKTFNKEDYLKEIIPLIEEIDNLIHTIYSKLNRVSNNQISEEVFIENTKNERLRIREIYDLSGNMNFAPYECTEVDAKYQEYITLAENMVVIYGEHHIQKQNSSWRLDQANNYYELANIELNNLRYELSKII